MGKDETAKKIYGCRVAYKWLSIGVGFLTDLKRKYIMKTEIEIANERILELEEQVKKLTSNTVLAVRCPLVEIDAEVLQMCIEMYQKGERLTAIKWLIEEAKRTDYTFGIKWAHEYFQKIGLEAVEGNDR